MATTHVVRKCIEGRSRSGPWVLGNLHLPNAFNSVRREYLLHAFQWRNQTIARFLQLAYDNLSYISRNLSLLDAHPALFIFRNFLFLPRQLFTHRLTPSFVDVENLVSFDCCIRDTTETLRSVQFGDTGWSQATHLLLFQRLVLQIASDIKLLAYAGIMNLTSIPGNRLCLQTQTPISHVRTPVFSHQSLIYVSAIGTNSFPPRKSPSRCQA